MDANKTWTVIIETPSGIEQVVVVRYPRRPTSDLAAGLVRLKLGMVEVPEEHRHQEDASLLALQAAGYRLVSIEQPR